MLFRSERSADISITSGGKTEKFTVTQKQTVKFSFTGVPTEKFSSDGGSFTITTTEGSSEPTVTALPEWVTHTPPSAKGTKTATTLDFVVLAHAGPDNRKGDISININGRDEKFTIEQLQKDAFTITVKPSEALPATENTFMITTSENMGTPTVGQLPEWITVATAPAARGLTNTQFYFTAKANTSISTREAIVIMTSNGQEASFTVTQKEVDSFTISGKPTESFAATGGDFTITATENTGVPKVGDLPAWITVATASATRVLTDTKLKFTVAMNSTYAIREATITITSGTAEPQSFKVTQAMSTAPFSIPDANFKKQLLARSALTPQNPAHKIIDTNHDNEISFEEAALVTHIEVINQEIESLVGIEHFTNLESLICYRNSIPNLDLSKNTKLTYLSCHNNQLAALDLSENTKLTYLDCSDNQLNTLDLSDNSKLTTLWCSVNQLETLVVSRNTALIELRCYRNQLTALELPNSTALTQLYCFENQLTTLELTNSTALTQLDCYSNQLETLVVSSNTVLLKLNCQDNQLQTIDLSSNTKLTRLDCNDNQLTTLDITNNPALTWLICDPMNDAMGNNLLRSVFLTQAQENKNNASKFIIAPPETDLKVKTMF